MHDALLDAPVSIPAEATRRWAVATSALRITGACVSGVLCRVAIDPAAPWPALLLSWALLIVAVDQLSWRRAAALGLLQGLVAAGLGFHWLYVGFHHVLSFSIAKAALSSGGLILSLALRSAVIAGCYRLAAGRGWPSVVAFPLALVATELVYPSVFPWYTGHFGLVLPIWSQLAEFGGPLALSFWIALVNAGFAQAWLCRRRWQLAMPGLVCALSTLATVSVVGWLQLRALAPRIQAAKVARIGVVQGNLKPARLETRDPIRAYRSPSIDLLRRDPNLDLIVWPETAIYSRTLATQLPAFVRDSIWHASDPGDLDLNVPLLIGMSLKDAPPECASEPCPERMQIPLSNSAVLVSQRGRVLGQYDKRRLMPFGESSILPRFLRDQSAVREEYRAGNSDAALSLGSHRLGVSICYEDILHRNFRSAVATSNPDLLINLTSDSWFRLTAASGLHLNLARLRAVEHRRFLLRSTTTGVSSLVSPTGEVVWSLQPDRAASGVASVRWLRGTTLYESVGDWPWLFTVPMLLLLCCSERKSLERLGRGRLMV